MVAPHSLTQIQSDLAAGSYSMEQVVRQYLDNIKEAKELNAYIEVFEDEVIEKANALDRKIQSKQDLGSLYGLVISIKDVICYKDHKVSAGSKMLENFESIYTATALQRLLDEDAIVIGRTNCDEFAMGSETDSSIYGPTVNGLGKNLTPGGSSGGTAVSVQRDTCLVALGSDTGGSVRQPAAFCGVHGFKPAYGKISRYGLIAYASSFDQIGIVSKDIASIESVYEVMRGHDPMDSTSVKIQDLPLEETTKYSFAFIEDAVQHEGLSSLIRKATEECLQQLSNQGHSVSAIKFDLLEYLVPCYYVLTTAEASSNLSRYDGVRYGHRSPDASTLEELYQKTRTEAFGTEVKRRIMLGTFVLSAGYYEDYYEKAQKIRRIVAERIEDIFEKYDFLIMPTTPGPPWEIGKFDGDPVSIYLSDIFTVLANLSGIPAISLHIRDDENGLPIGLQIMSAKHQGAKLLEASKYVSQLA